MFSGVIPNTSGADIIGNLEIHWGIASPLDDLFDIWNRFQKCFQTGLALDDHGCPGAREQRGKSTKLERVTAALFSENSSRLPESGSPFQA